MYSIPTLYIAILVVSACVLSIMDVENEDDDPVIREIDVFLSKSSAENLYLFQYPIRPANHIYEQSDHTATRIKPKQHKVELELSVNTKCKSYSRSKGEQIALNVDGRPSDGGDGSFYKTGVFDKQVLSSTSVSSDCSRYAIGLLKEDQLHLTPLKQIISLKPSFTYLDSSNVKSKLPSGKNEADSSQDEADDEAKPVVVKYGRQETEEMKARRMASYEYLEKMSEEEPWMNLSYHGIQSRESELERLQLLAADSGDISQFHMTAHDYYQQLLQSSKEELSEAPSLPSNVLSLSQLKTLPLNEQVKALLINAKTIRFSQLLALLAGNNDVTSILRNVQQVAALVQGCWVVKSELLYPKDSSESTSGLSSEVMCRCRDFIMWKFTQSRYVDRKDISSAIKLPAEQVKELLEQMSRMRANRGWEFVFEYDRDFVDKYTEIAQRQKKLWDARFQTLCTQLKLSKEAEKKGRDQMGVAQITQRSRSNKPRSRTLSGRSCSDISDSDLDIKLSRRQSSDDKIAKVRSPVKQKRKSISTETDSGTEQSDAAMMSDENMDIDTSKPLGEKVTLPYSEPVDLGTSDLMHNGDVSDELIQELDKFALDGIKSKLVLNQSEIKRLFALKLMQCPSGHILGSGVSFHLLEAAIIRAGASKINSMRWPSNVVKEPLYVAMALNDEYDVWRSTLVELLEAQYRIKLSSFKEALEAKINSTVSEIDCKTFLKEYCTKRGSKWLLRGTYAGSS